MRKATIIAIKEEGYLAKMQPVDSQGKRKFKSRARVYVLLRSVQHCTGDAVSILRQNYGVVSVNKIEGPHDIIVVMEAKDRPKLAKAVVKALASVEVMTDTVDLLPVQNRTIVSSITRDKI